MGNDGNKPDFSSVRSSVESTAKDAPEAKADFSDARSTLTSTADEATIYEVQAGNNLSKIAKHFYGNGNEWNAIFEANRDQLTDPDYVKPGQMLKIPVKF
jgi:nucleoid-associated protein YgaU